MEHFLGQTTLGHKTSFIKFKKIEMVSHIFSEYNGMKLGINYKKKTENTQKHGC